MKIAVSIPDSLFEAAEQVARQENISRSRLYARALELLLTSLDDADLTARLDAVYATEDSRLEPDLAAAQAAAVARSDT